MPKSPTIMRKCPECGNLESEISLEIFLSEIMKLGWRLKEFETYTRISNGEKEHRYRIYVIQERNKQGHWLSKGKFIMKKGWVKYLNEGLHDLHYDIRKITEQKEATSEP